MELNLILFNSFLGFLINLLLVEFPIHQKLLLILFKEIFKLYRKILGKIQIRKYQQNQLSFFIWVWIYQWCNYSKIKGILFQIIILYQTSLSRIYYKNTMVKIGSMILNLKILFFQILKIQMRNNQLLKNKNLYKKSFRFKSLLLHSS